MAHKKFFLGFLVLALVCGMMVAGCSDDPVSGDDIWTDVTSLSQMNGTWKFSIDTGTKSYKDFFDDDERWEDEELEALLGSDMMITMVYQIVITANSNEPSCEIATIMSIAFTGGNINDTEAWVFLKEEHCVGDLGVTADDAARTIAETIGMTFDNELLINDFLSNYGLQINQYGTKLRLSTDFFGGVEEGMPEFLILLKQ